MASKAKRDGRLLLLHELTKNTGTSFNAADRRNITKKIGISSATLYRDIDRLRTAQAAIAPEMQKVLTAPTLF